jgi:hypothetical protein
MESSVYTSFWPAFYCSKLMGAMPLKRVGCQLQWSWCALVYIFLYAVPCAVFTFGTPYLMLTDETTLNVSRLLEIFNSSLAGLTGLMSLIMSVWKIGALPSLLNKFRHVDVCFLHTPPETNRNVLIYSLCHCLIIISICGIVVVLMIWEYIGVITTGVNIFLSLTQMYLAIAEIQFVCLCYALSQRYKHINNHIKKMCSIGFSNRTGLHISTLKSEDEQEIYVTLKKFRKSHRCLYDIGKNLNRMYDGQLFLSVIGCFTLTVFCFYYGITYYRREKYISTGMLVMSFQYFLRFYIINCCCHSTSEEVRFFTIILLNSSMFPRGRRLQEAGGKYAMRGIQILILRHIFKYY